MKNQNIKKILDLQLKDYTLLPEINDEKIVIIFDIVKGDISESPMDIVLYYKGNEIWREPVFFENPERFKEISIILFQRYNNLADIIFDETRQGSATWLFGDNLDGPNIIKRARKNIRRKYNRLNNSKKNLI